MVREDTVDIHCKRQSQTVRRFVVGQCWLGSDFHTHGEEGVVNISLHEDEASAEEWSIPPDIVIYGSREEMLWMLHTLGYKRAYVSESDGVNAPSYEKTFEL